MFYVHSDDSNTSFSDVAIPIFQSNLLLATLAAAPVVAAVVAAAAAAPVVTSEVVELSRAMGFFGVGTPFTAAVAG